MQDQNEAGVTSSEWHHPNVAFNNAFLKEETQLSGTSTSVMVLLLAKV